METENSSIKLCVLTTHPIQYYAPVFQRLAARDDLSIRVFYGWKGLVDGNVDVGFGKTIQWDIPLLNGYDYDFLENKSENPGSHHFNGIRCPNAEKQIREFAPDAILVYGWSYHTHLAVIKKLKGSFPILFRGDSTLLDPQPFWKRVARSIRLKHVYRHIDHALYVGTRNKEYFLAHGLEESQLTHAPHAIDNQRFCKNESTKALATAFRQELGIPENHRVVMFVGKLESKKAPQDLLAAFKLLSRQNSNLLSLVFVGTGPLLEELCCQKIENVHFAGFRNQTELPLVYAAADVVVLPSRGPGETWGLTINEAMAAGRAVVTSDRVGCAIDLVPNEKTGWTFPAGNIDALAHILDQISAMSEESLDAMKANAVALIGDWTFEKQVAGIVRTLLKACRHE